MKRYIENIWKLARNRGGNAMIELAIGSGILVSAFVGTFEFGYTFVQYNNLQSAVVRGGRYASLLPYDSPTTTPSTGFQTSVKNMVIYGSPTAGSSPVLPNLTPAKVSLVVTFANGITSAMTVSINGYIIDSLFGTTTLTTKPKMTYTYQGIWSPV